VTSSGTRAMPPRTISSIVCTDLFIDPASCSSTATRFRSSRASSVSMNGASTRAAS
jgi:hypothetical protein